MALASYVLLATASALLTAFTTAYQSATLYWGKRLAPDNEALPRGMQDAITPRAQAIRIRATLVGLASTGVLGYALLPLTYALLGFSLTLLLSVAVHIALPGSRTAYFRGRIERALRKRRLQSIELRDHLRVAVLDDILARFEAL